MKKSVSKKRKPSRWFFWFFRAQVISGILVFCTLAFLLGSAACYAAMRQSITGQPIALVEFRQNDLLFLGKTVCRAGWLREWIERME